jgi:hypothetical protein
MTLQLVVAHADNSFSYYPVPDGWRIDRSSGCIVIGKGVPRTYIPLDSVRSFSIERVSPWDSPADATQLTPYVPRAEDFTPHWPTP